MQCRLQDKLEGTHRVQTHAVLLLTLTLTLMHQIHTGRAPQYLVDSVQSVAESRSLNLRSANTADYVKRCTRTNFGERCFSHAGPAAWNSLPASIKLTTDTNRFKKLLKAHLFHIAFWHFVSAPGQFVSRALQIPICICNCNLSTQTMPVVGYPSFILGTKFEHLGSFVFKLSNRQSNKQSASNILPTPTDKVSIGD